MTNTLLKLYLQTKYKVKVQEINNTDIRMHFNDMWIIISNKKDINVDNYCYAYLPSNQPELDVLINTIKQDYKKYEEIILFLKDDLNKTENEMKQYLIEHIEEVKI